MSPHRAPQDRSSVVVSVALVSLATLTALAGCSKRPHEVLGPTGTSAEHVAASERSLVLAPPPPDIHRWEAPRISVWTDGWRRVQREGGVFLTPDRIYDLDIPEQQPVTFHWSAKPRTGRGEIIGYRWAVDMTDITDETPRSGPDDVNHWSAWSTEESSVTLGPFAADPSSVVSHYFFVEARDNVGFFSLFTIRLRVGAASEDLPLTRR